MKEGSRVEVIQALWNYIKIKGLQDKMERRFVKMDDALQPVRLSSQSPLILFKLCLVFWQGPHSHQ
jgi:chromatin remodeling complex protein RSC6